ncbi:MAG: hypothetical protein EHM21_00700 [Chloroflexi bacterium]|nr:MAG: hypothetical protein EHM21_00700 [Chloroflexota bacterium]
MILKKRNVLWIIEIALLLFIITITFYPSLRKATIYRDDWYYTLDRLIGGPQAFHEMFRIDRPARGYFFEAYYRLFGVEPAPYHLSAFFWRLLTGLSAFWFLRLLWPNHRQAALLISLLFVIFPGYTRWLEGFEDQPKIVSLFLEVTSFALTLKAIGAKGRVAKTLLWAGSILTGWGYLALIDYAIGMEVFRYLCIFVFVSRDHPGKSWGDKSLAALRAGFPSFLIAGGFLFWRLFIFKNERSATDINLQLGALVSSPLITGTWWLIRQFQSILNTAIFAWTGPYIQGLFSLRAREILIGLGTAAAAGAAVFTVFFLTRNNREEKESHCPPSWQGEAVVLGIMGVTLGVVPVIIANRMVTFGPYSHYALPVSLASAMLAGGLIGWIPSRPSRILALAGLVVLGVASQYVAVRGVLKEEEIINTFWHQVAWRAPGIRPGATLAVAYPSVNYGEDVDAVNGPANFIYFPEQTNQLPARYPLYALEQADWTGKDVLGGGEKTAGYRTHYGQLNFDDLLVISQPTEDACVRVIDQRWPWFSYNDDNTILLVGQNSNIENVLTGFAPKQLPASIFGPESDHNWCYYFAKAGLALQMEDWNKIVQLGDEALQKKLHPQEQTEWIPFLQAYAVLGDTKNIKIAASKINQSAFNRRQACSVLTKMQEHGYSFNTEVKDQISELFCLK